MRYWKIWLAVLLAGGAQLALATEYTDRLIVKLRAPVASAQMYTAMSANQASALSHIAGVQLAVVRAMTGGGQVMRLSQSMTVAEAQAVADKMQSNPDVEYAEPDRIRRPMLVPNDTYYSGYQWNLNGTYGIQAPAAWNTTTGSSGVVVAVLDTGITAHAELAGRTLPGYDFITNTFVANDGDGRDADPSDPGDWVTVGEMNTPPCSGVAENSSWHGTAITGLIGAISNNSIGIAGINWVSKILPVRVMGKCGGYMSDIVDGMRWAAGLSVSGVPSNANPAKVLNLSLGSAGACSATEQNAINEIVALNKVIVVAAGNDSGDVANSAPANCSGVIAVAATTQSGSLTLGKPSLANGSNTGSLVAISAPGGEWNDGIYMLTNTGTTVSVSDYYYYYFGTSIAAAEVSGVVSLMFSVNSQLSPDQVKNILQSTAIAFPGSTCTTTTCGAGIVNAAAAVSLASTTTGTPIVSSSSSGGGGGCAFSSVAPFDPILAGIAGAALAGLCWRRIGQQ